MSKKWALLGIPAVFSFHVWWGDKRISPTQQITEKWGSNFPKLGQSEYPSLLTKQPETIILASVALPIIAGGYFWTIHALKQVKNRHAIGMYTAIATTGLIAFDVYSWVSRLRTYGIKYSYDLSPSGEPMLVTRGKYENEILWYRCNQLVVPSVLILGGYFTGLAPQLLVPIFAWKGMWHFVLLFNRDTVMTDLGVGKMRPYRLLEEKIGAEASFKAFCVDHKLIPTDKAKELYIYKINNE